MKTKGVSKCLLLLTVSAALATSACATFGQKAEDKAPGGIVVTQVAKKDPVVASHDRKFYLDMRQSKKLLPKLEATLATGEGDAAVQLARAYLAKRPGDVQGLTMLAAALAMTRNYDLADYYAMLAERAQGGNAAALNIRGLALMLGPNRKAADFHRAQEYFRQAFDADPLQVAAGLNGGALALELGNPQGAVQLYEGAVSRCNQCVAGVLGLGVALARTGKAAEAKSSFEQVLAKKPNHPQALYNLALVYKNGYNDSKQAEKHLFALLNDSKTKDVALRERAHTVLRMIKGEASREERTMIADDEAAPAEAGEGTKEPSLGDERDAELLMTGAEMNEP